jgi:hypothetical protein
MLLDVSLLGEKGRVSSMVEIEIIIVEIVPLLVWGLGSVDLVLIAF